MITKQMCSRILLSSATLLLASATAVAQAHPGGAGTPSTVPNQQQATPGAPGSPGSDPNSMNSQQSMSDQAFVRKAMEGGTAEVQLGQLAQQKSQSEDVKQFGQKMVADHTQLATQLMQPIAKHLGVAEPKGPSKKDKQFMAKLQALSGPQFDEEYIRAMVKDHKQDLKDFKTEAEMTQDPSVKQAAEQGSTVISQHLQLIEQIAQSHNVPTDGKSKETSSIQ